MPLTPTILATAFLAPSTLGATLATTWNDWSFSWWWFLVAGAYVMGMFPTALTVGYFVNRNPTKEGSGNPGTANMYRLAGKIPGVTVAVGDVIKAALPTLLGLYVADSRELALVCGSAAVFGHVFPVIKQLKGGKGAASFGGLTLALNPLAAISALIMFFLAIWIWDRISLGSIIAAPSVLIGMAFYGREWWEMTIVAVMSVVVILRHTENIKRILKNEEVKV